MIDIDGRRLLDDLRTLATFGKVGSGVHRPAFSASDLEARRWLRQRMAAANLEHQIDRVGNVYGRSPGDRRTILIGSHTDTVPNGGWLDGALGVIYGLEIARAMIEGRHRDGVDVISFQDEEGAFLPFLGSKSYCGLLGEPEIAQAVGRDGRALGDVLMAVGYADALARREPGRQVAYLEAHIEQGPKLETAGRRIGVVTGIVGIRRFRLSAQGQADHAGTTPMHMRKDAGGALIGLASAILDGIKRWSGPHSVWNIGQMEFKPGAANVVPAQASLTLEFRDLEEKVLDGIQAGVERCATEARARGPVAIDVHATARVVGVAMDPGLGGVLADAARARGHEPLAMPSGAGHDAMVLARALPSAMLFIPSIGGRSHDIAEDTADEDIVLGCQVLADAVDAILASARARA